MQDYEQEHIEKLRPYLAECMVLLRYNGAFPLDKPCRIAAFGNGLRDTVKGGSGSGEVNSRYFINVQQGLEDAGFTITNHDWPERYDVFLQKAKEDLHTSIKRKAKEQGVNVIVASMGAVMKQPDYQIELDLSADAAIYVLARQSGEGNDRLPEAGDFALTASEVRDILALDRAYERFMLVINTGGPVDLSPVAGIGNILVLSQLGVETGAALADVLLGKSYPSGKLATTWAAYEDYCSLGDFAERDDTRYREGIFVGYRYFDAMGKRALFPFGFGLGYTNFSLEPERAECAGTQIALKARITNTGTFAGKETMQVYASCPQGRLCREEKSLVGFAKTDELQPSQSQTLEIAFDIRDLSGYDSGRACYILEAGTYILLVGTSSVDAKACASFTLKGEHMLRQCRNLFGSTDFEDADLRADQAPLPQGLPELDLDENALATETVTYDDLASIDPILSPLTNNELAYLCIGSFNPKGGLLSVIGNASQQVAGAAGESTFLLKDKGIDSLVMADGPAGLRLSEHYYEDEKGLHSVGMSIPESMLDLFPAPIKRLLTRKPKIKEGVELKEQYATALPIASAIAQSFNLEFARICGDIVGSEMDIFDVDLWLAPALNIHRNVLCGRNFEYYSEDPFLSGMFAAAVTQGVQGHPGRGVTIKHYAANNQETNRYANNSMVSERTLREIYLKGFQICVRESSPKAVMTSYNLINGIHTSESRGLTQFLRQESGFEGIVMTDWVVGGKLLTGKTKYDLPDPAKVAAAGCSLFMPGSKKDHKALMAGLKKGTVTRNDLERAATYLLRTIHQLKHPSQETPLRQAQENDLGID